MQTIEETYHNLSSQSLAYFDYQIQECVQTGGNKSLIDYSGIKVRRKIGTRMIFGPAIFHIPMDNTFDAVGVAYKKQGGEYKK